MPSLEDFRQKLASNADDAMKEYALLIDFASLDYAAGVNGETVFADFKRVSVVFEYELIAGKNIIRMRAKSGADVDGKEISYLPWKNAASGAVARATLDGDGPAYFSTSQLDGCRFTLQYHDADRKKVTVLHLAGDYGGSGKDGSEARDQLENAALPAAANPQLRRRFSVGTGVGKMGRIGSTYKAGRADTAYYDGGKATVFGYRNKQGAWVFYGQDMTTSNQGQGLKNLGTGAQVAGPINADAQR